MNTAAVVLFIAYAMPGQMPDVALRLPEPSLQICWQEAKDFVDHGVPEIAKSRGAIGAYAGCRVNNEHTIEE